MIIIPLHLTSQNVSSRSNVVETSASYEDAKKLVHITPRLITAINKAPFYKCFNDVMLQVFW